MDGAEITTPRDSTTQPGALGRLGLWVTRHRRTVALIWMILVVGLGIFAPAVERNLSGAGWQADGSDSVAVRDLAQQHFGGDASHAVQVVVHRTDGPVLEDEGARVLSDVAARLRRDPRVSRVVMPVAGVSLSHDGRTAIVLAGAGADTNAMVRAASDIKDDLTRMSTATVEVTPTGSSLLWSDFNAANLEAMMRSEMVSWPITLAILILAFGALVAAGLPLMLTVAGLIASAGSLVLINALTPVSIWAMNFAMMFALALGIDYALFIVARFRAARMGQHRTTPEAIAETMDTAGKAVALSGVTVVVSLSAVLLVPSPAFRSMAGGIMLSVVFVVAATLTLLPLVLVALDGRINRLALPWVRVGAHRSPRFAAWGERLWRRPVPWGLGAIAVLVALAAPIVGLTTDMPSIKVLPNDASTRLGYQRVQEAFGPGAPGTLQIIVDASDAQTASAVVRSTSGIAGQQSLRYAADGSGLALLSAVPAVDPSDPKLASIVTRLRLKLPDSARVGGAAVENIDLAAQLDRSTPIVIAVVLVLGFGLLLIALQAPLIAVLGTLASLLSTASAFGVARLIFQDGHGAGFLGFASQGFLDAWAPVFFFAMIFAIAMDYTVFLLTSAKEHWEREQDPHAAMVGAVAHSGRVIFAAGAVMVAVFFTFAVSGPLPPKEMGVILGVAVLLDAFLVRLVLLPVILRLTGSAAWACPAWLRRILPAISFSHT